MADTREYVQKFANENGGDIFVEDVKLAEAGHQTTISDEEIVLKGTDGVMHKIDKSSFSEAVRGVLGPILYNLSKESGITKVLTMSGANANAADIGTTTLANLASALGVIDLKFTSRATTVNASAGDYEITFAGSAPRLILFCYDGSRIGLYSFSEEGVVTLMKALYLDINDKTAGNYRLYVENGKLYWGCVRDATIKWEILKTLSAI